MLPDVAGLDPVLEAPLHTLLERGPLARRLLAAVGAAPDREALLRAQAQLADCLRQGSVFGA